MSDYFSDRENGPRARTDHMISPVVWAGLVGTMQALVNSGAVGLRRRHRQRSARQKIILDIDNEQCIRGVRSERIHRGSR